jgi:hypothetical protein
MILKEFQLPLLILLVSFLFLHSKQDNYIPVKNYIPRVYVVIIIIIIIITGNFVVDSARY